MYGYSIHPHLQWAIRQLTDKSHTYLINMIVSRSISPSIGLYICKQLAPISVISTTKCESSQICVLSWNMGLPSEVFRPKWKKYTADWAVQTHIGTDYHLYCLLYMLLWIAPQAIFTTNSLFAPRSHSKIVKRNAPSIYWSTELNANVKNRARLKVAESRDGFRRAVAYLLWSLEILWACRPLATCTNCCLPSA